MLSRIYCVAKIITVLSNPFCRVSSKNMMVFEFWGRESTRAHASDERRSLPCFVPSVKRVIICVLRISLDGFPYLPPQRVEFLRRFGMKTGIHFTHFGLESGMVFERTTGVYERIYRFNSR